MLKKNSGFTLAEVLITLGIIGVVGAMTIPSLMNKTNDAELKSKMKKNFSVLSQATTLIIANNGTIDTSASDKFAESYEKVLKKVKTDYVKNLFASEYKYYENLKTPGYTYYATSNGTAFVLSDGSVIRFDEWSPTCEYEKGTFKNICGSFNVDVNGKQKPNMIGKDMYGVWLLWSDGEYYIKPFGSEGFYSCHSGSESSTDSYGCTAEILYK